ncbi:uncharacterized protein LOC115789728 [Archocentrus centrarchus]|uniref:uncharacterized protein LOC115789728 n=1 Tax=Archocentrus centrarchus TaxID=63155 RepID=UPI0011EA1B9D|nr:uncharacterized protein LOC115789728 [Archocentrus centrarchus]
MSLRRLSFKWFGSLTNLTFRRSTEKSDSKSSKSKSGAGAGCAQGDDDDGCTVLTPVVETSVDDLEAMRPRTASYVRSSESYTHVGTLPRLLKRKRDKSNKGCPSSSKKGKDKISRSQSQRPAGDRSSLRLTGAKSKEAEDVIKADSGPKTKLECGGESKATNASNITSGPASACEDVSPSGGSGAELQSETCDKQGVTEAGADLNPDTDSSSPPLSHENDETHADDGLQPGAVSEPKEESREPAEGADTGNQQSDGIYR